MVNVIRVLWLIALNLNGQSICCRTGHTNYGIDRNGLRVPVKRIGTIAKFTPAAGYNYLGSVREMNHRDS